MAEDIRRIKAVAAALRGIRERVIEDDHMDEWSTAVYDKWIGMLKDAIEGDTSTLALDNGKMRSTDFLTHLDAAIAFLEVYEKDGANILSMKPRSVW